MASPGSTLDLTIMKIELIEGTINEKHISPVKLTTKETLDPINKCVILCELFNFNDNLIFFVFSGGDDK